MTQKQEVVSIDLKTLMVPISILLVGAMVSGAIFFGLRSSGSSPSGGGKPSEEQAEILGEAAPGEPPGQQGSSENDFAKTSIDDDAVLGDKNTAQVAVVEFSDYECSFCNRFRTQTFGQIKKDYVDNGKAIFVYRDLPLPFHNPAAEREAIAAECAREQGRDDVYYQYHDSIFETSPGNGKGISVKGLVKLAGEIGLNKDQFESCLEEEKYKDEVSKDAADAAKVGINGTPGFVVGKLDESGNVEGMIVSGAQPYSAFQRAIEEYLK